jgi:negative regulator of flagellin synthesis FlgM
LRDADRVEVSPLANYLNLLREIEPYRPGLVERVREEIGAGSYDTPERIDLAVDTLFDEEPGLFE